MADLAKSEKQVEAEGLDAKALIAACKWAAQAAHEPTCPVAVCAVQPDGTHDDCTCTCYVGACQVALGRTALPSTTPSAGAEQAEQAIWDEIVALGYGDLPLPRITFVNIIDEQTGLPELVAVLKAIMDPRNTGVLKHMHTSTKKRACAALVFAKVDPDDLT